MPGPNDMQFKALDHEGHYVASESSDLGHGAYGQVKKAIHTPTSQVVAIKLIGGEILKHDHKNRVESEIINHSRLDHPHVVAFREALCLKDGSLGIALEYCNRGNLAAFLDRRDTYLTEREARWYFQQIMLALDYCHQSGVVNRDVKPANVVLQEGSQLQQINAKRREAGKPPFYTAKLCDFGYSKSNDRSAPKSLVGTLEYMAPEHLAPMPAGVRQLDGAKLDIWSAGITLFHLLCADPPFLRNAPANPRDELERLVGEMHSRAWQNELRPDISHECRSLLSRMLDPNPASRISMQEILADVWFREDLDPRSIAMHQQALGRRQAALPRQPPQRISDIVAQAKQALAEL